MRSDLSSRSCADALITWLREYAVTRINSALIDERRGIPPHVVLDFGNRGLFGLRVPRASGGLGLAQADVVRVMAQLGAIDLTLAALVSSHANGVRAIQEHGSPALRNECLVALASGREIAAFALTEPGAGSNIRAIQTRAAPDGSNGWVLDGVKSLVDSGSWAGVVTVFARTADRGGAAETSSGISAFAVRQGAAGLSIGSESLTMGLRGMVQNTMSLRGVRVGGESLLGSVGDGVAISQDVLSLARLNLAAKALGGIKRCLQLLHRYAASRMVATGLLWDNPVTQSRVVQLASAAGALEALVARMAARVDAGQDVPTDAFLACKVAASEHLWQAADTLVQVLGGRGYVETNIAPLLLRDARSFLISEGPNEALTMYLGSRVLHAGNQLERFLREDLGAPVIAERLKSAVDVIRVRSSTGAIPQQIGESAALYWAASLAGEIAIRALLAAAARAAVAGAPEIVGTWAELRFSERIAELAEAGLADWALGQKRAVEDMIGAYADAIGDVEQRMPGPETRLDPLLRHGGPDAAAASYLRDRCVHEMIADQAARVPDRIAVTADRESLSYRELEARANRLARRLRAAGVAPEVRVGLCVDRSTDLVVSLLAIWKAGGAYVPLDSAHPRRRVARMLDESGISVIVAHDHLASALPDHQAVVIRPDEWRDVDPAGGAEAGLGPANADRCAYVLYTSGSTGQPKGVEVCHRSLTNVLCSMQSRPGFSEDDVLVAVTTLSFDISVLELVLPLMTGGRTVVAAVSATLDGGELARLLDESGATVLQATPVTWQMLVTGGWRGRPALRALCGGDVLRGELAQAIRARTACLWNMYGPTETTVWSSLDEVAGDGPITIGRPIANTRIYVLDESLERVPPGVPGEIFIGGDGVARGYCGRPDLTSERFLPDPFRAGERLYRTGDLGRFLPDGRLEHLGRVDHQIKIRGFRVELGEIEAALAAHESVRDVVVTARHDEAGDASVTAYVTLSPGEGDRTSIADLAKHVRERVPAPMVPSAFVVLDALPRTPNGKVDRSALPAPDPGSLASGAEGDPPATPVEQEIARIWATVFRIPAVGREADFFALGGHSLLAVQILSRVRSAFEVEIPIAAIFRHPTVAALAQTVEDARTAGTAAAKPR